MPFGVNFRAGKKKGKKGDEKKSKQVAQRRKQAQKMGFYKTEDGAKWKTSEMGSRAGSLDQAYGKQVNGMTATQLARAAAEIFDGSQSGETPFRIKFLEPVRHYWTCFACTMFICNTAGTGKIITVQYALVAIARCLFRMARYATTK